MKDSVRRKANRLKLKVRGKAPLALTIFGMAAGAAATVIACIKARHMDEELEPINAEITEAEADVEATSNETELKAAKKKLNAAKAKKVGKLVKMFALPALLGVLSAASVAGSYHVAAADLAGVTATLRKEHTAFKEYRGAAREKLGEAVDKELRFGKRQSTVEVKNVDEETGEITTQEVKSTDVRDGGLTDFAIPFCATYCGSAFLDNPYYDNQTILNAIQNAELKMRRDGYVFLSDIYKEFNFDQTPDSRKVGRMIGKDEDPNTVHIDYTVEETMFTFNNDEDGKPIYERGYIIDFINLDVICDCLPKPRKKGMPR